MADRPTEPIPPGGGWGQPPQQGPPASWGAPPPPGPPGQPNQPPWWRRAWVGGLIWGVVGFVAGAAAGVAGAEVVSGLLHSAAPPDLDCPEIGETDFTVQGADPHGFDGDNDGVGCES